MCRQSADDGITAETVQVLPSLDVATFWLVGEDRPATEQKIPSAGIHKTEFQWSDVGIVPAVHVTPSGDQKGVAAPEPKHTNKPSAGDQALQRMLPTPPGKPAALDHVSPSVETLLNALA
jgi:hypothetical protein